MDMRLLIGGTLVLTGIALPSLLRDGKNVLAVGPNAGSAQVQEPAAGPDAPATDSADADSPDADSAAGDLATATSAELPATSTSATAPRAQVPTPNGGGVNPSSVPLIVEVRRESDGSEYATVIGANVSIRSIVDRLGKRTGRLVFGFEADERGLTSPLVTIDLRDRPLADVLEFALGTAGLVGELSKDVLDVREDPLTDDSEGLRLRALAGYGRAAYAYPDHGLAASARLAQGSIEEERGIDQAALSHYQLLIESHPSSDLVLEALMRSGAIYQRMGEWSQAIKEYKTISELSPVDLRESEHGHSQARPDPLEHYVQAAKLEIARCNIELGNTHYSLLTLSVLDIEHPPASREQVIERRVLLAEAHLAEGNYISALETLDELERGYLPADVAVQAVRIRARCFDGMDLRHEAARAWMIYAREIDEPQRSAAYERAAELFLALEDYLEVIFVAAEVERTKSLANVRTDLRIARSALGLEVSLTADNASIQERVDASEVAAERGDWNEVSTLLGPLFGELELAPEHLRDNIALGRAAALHATQGLDAAIGALSEARSIFVRTQPEDTDLLDVYAGQLYESEGRFDRAYDAYEGNY